jgi:hypothetical protein
LKIIAAAAIADHGAGKNIIRDFANRSEAEVPDVVGDF